MLQLQGAQVWSLVREQKPQMPWGTAKKLKNFLKYFKKILNILKSLVLDFFFPLKKEFNVDLLHQSEWTFFTLDFKPKCKLNWLRKQAVHRSATKSSGSPIPWPFFPHSPQIWALLKNNFQGKVYHFPTLSEEKFYLFKKRTNLLSHSWRLTVKIVCDKELDPLHFFCGNDFCASITFTKQT